MLHYLIFAILIHVLPNIFMKVVKSTKLGHKVLSATFELGLQGKQLSTLANDLITYILGPEALVDYNLGLMINKKREGKVNIEEVRVEIQAQLKENVQDDVSKVPFLNTLENFAHGTNALLLAIITLVLTTGSTKRTSVNYIVYVILVTVVFFTDVALLLQPIICYVRKTIGTSEFGKKVLKNNLVKGIKGIKFTKVYEVICDIFVAPSVLDTQRLGLFLAKQEASKEQLMFQTVMFR